MFYVGDESSQMWEEKHHTSDITNNGKDMCLNVNRLYSITRNYAVRGLLCFNGTQFYS